MKLRRTKRTNNSSGILSFNTDESVAILHLVQHGDYRPLQRLVHKGAPTESEDTKRIINILNLSEPEFSKSKFTSDDLKPLRYVLALYSQGEQKSWLPLIEEKIQSLNTRSSPKGPRIARKLVRKNSAKVQKRV